MNLRQAWVGVVNYFDLQRDNRNKPAAPKSLELTAQKEPESLGRKVINYFDLRIK